MSLTITPIGAVNGTTFSAHLKMYVETSPATTYYVLDGTHANASFRFIVDPTRFDANPNNWASGYILLLDSLFSS